MRDSTRVAKPAMKAELEPEEGLARPGIVLTGETPEECQRLTDLWVWRIERQGFDRTPDGVSLVIAPVIGQNDKGEVVA